MHQFSIQFHSFEDVQRFVDLATQFSFPIVVGSDSYHVNGTSFMGMFSLDYSRPLRVTLTCSDEDAARFREAAKSYLT